MSPVRPDFVSENDAEGSFQSTKASKLNKLNIYKKWIKLEI